MKQRVTANDLTGDLRWWQRVLVSLIIAAGLVGIGYGLITATTGDGSADLPTGIERIDPVRSAVQVPAQTPIFVDLEAGYTGELTLDGFTIPTASLNGVGVTGETLPLPAPGQEVSVPVTATVYEPGNATLTFTPRSGAPVESLAQGVHTVSVRYWKIVDGPGTSRTYSWTFNVF